MAESQTSAKRRSDSRRLTTRSMIWPTVAPHQPAVPVEVGSGAGVAFGGQQVGTVPACESGASRAHRHGRAATSRIGVAAVPCRFE
jgi:hypothetical protein